MGLTTQQGIIIYSPEILLGEKLQAVISEITPSYITILVPFKDLEILVGTVITVQFWDEAANYAFKTHAINTKETNENFLKIARPATITKSINRSYPRVAVDIMGDIFDPENINRNKCQIQDLSASGAMLISKTERKANELVKLSFILPDGEIFEDVNGQVMWVKKGKDGNNSYGIQFQALSEIRRNKLIKYVNNELRKSKK